MQVSDAQTPDHSVDDTRPNESHTIYTQLISNITRDLSSHEEAQYWIRFHWIVGGTVLLQQPLNVTNFCKLLAYSSEKQELYTPRSAQSVLSPWIDILNKSGKFDTTVSERHQPFHDFVFCEDHNADDKPWTIPASLGHRRLLDCCIGLMSMTLKRNICGLPSLGSYRGEASDAKVAECIPAHIQYACEYWATHVELLTVNEGGNPELDDDGPIHSFLILHILHWIEALTLMGRFSNGILIVMQLMTLAPKESQLHAFLYDAKKFLLRNQAIIKQAPLQIYTSAIIFSPKESIIRQLHSQNTDFITLLSSQEEYWGPSHLILEAETGSVRCLSFSLDSRRLAMASASGVTTWDTTTGKTELVRGLDKGRIDGIEFSPDGRKLAIKSLEGNLSSYILEVETGSIVHNIDSLRGVQMFQFSPDGSKLAVSLNEKSTLLLDTTNWQTEHHFYHTGIVTALAFSPGGEWLVEASSTAIDVWNIQSGRIYRTFPETAESATIGLAFSRDPKKLMSVSVDGIIKERDIETGAVNSLGDIISPPCSEIPPDEKRLESRVEATKVWDAYSATMEHPFRGIHAERIATVMISPDSRMAASGCQDGKIVLWDLTAPHRDSTPLGHSGPVSRVLISPDGKTVATSSKGKDLCLWSTITGRVDRVIKDLQGWVTELAFSPTGDHLAAVYGVGKVVISEVSSGTMTPVPLDEVRTSLKLAFSPDGLKLAIGPYKESVRIFNIETGSFIRVFPDCWRSIEGLSFSLGGTMVGIKIDGIVMQAWSLITGKNIELSSEELHPSLWRLRYTPDMDSPHGSRQSVFSMKTNDWIYRDGERFLWLPVSRRPGKHDVRGNTVVIGGATGAISILKFHPDRITQF